jgi:CHAT domain-containing protein
MVAEKMLAKATQWKDIQSNLKNDEALIEIIRVRKYDFKRHQESLTDRVSFGFTDSTFYAALITTSETVDAPQLVLMKNGFSMEKRLLNYYRNALRFSVEDRYSYDSYWRAFDKNIRNKTKIYFAGDGVYYKLNLNILRDPADGKYIVQRYDVHYLLNPAQYLEKARASFTNQQAVLMGDPLFDMNLPNPSQTRNDTRFSALPGAQKEILNVNELLRSKGWQTSIYLKQAATEKNIKNVHSPSILHIATHGFFSTDVVPLTANAKKDFLFQSGLVLAGANNNLAAETEAIHDDGILTAYEVMNLDLSRTDLVILSACETGLGRIENGEGVYGLQRSFLQAGARDIMISLWKVDDRYTQALMTKFYQYLFEGKSKSDALKAAQLYLLQSTPDPLYWGGFILVGAD